MSDARQDYETAVALQRQGRLDDAERLYRKLRKVYPAHPGALHGLGLIALATGRYSDAVMHFRGVLAVDAKYPPALLGLGDALAVLGRVDEAHEAFARLLEADPKNAAGQFGMGGVLTQLGRFEEAEAAYATAIALAPKNARHHRALADAAPFTDGDPRLTALEALTQEILPDDQEIELHFALGKAYDDLKRYEAAFSRWRRGNALRRRKVPYDEAAVADFFREMRETFTAERLGGAKGDPSSLPVFVVGMPRSGTSLVEQILASHPDIHGAGELLALPELVDGATLDDAATIGARYVETVSALAPDAKRIVDKLPANFRLIGWIKMALPNARIIHVRRDPRDTCFSCYSKLFLNGLNYTYDLGELGRYHRLYESLMAHWRATVPDMLEVQYEALVGDFEAEAQRIVAYCSVGWDARCLRFHETERAVRTLSQRQVRAPLFSSGIGRWKPYEPWLGPLFEALGQPRSR
jgi:tetratricopeptide (TPR) repeat protein